MKIVSFEIAKALKEAGFHEKTTHFYNDTYDDEDNPTHQFELCGASIPSYVQDWNDTNKHPEYDESHVNYWDNVWSAPTYFDVMCWLMDTHNIYIFVQKISKDSKSCCYIYQDYNCEYEYFDDWYEAFEWGIEQSIKKL